MAEPYIGQIIMFGGNFAIRGYSFCNGQLIAISQNSALFSILGTIYGGDGRTTFALPDMRGRAPIHSGNGSRGPGLSSYPLGSRGGIEQVTLNLLEIPQHNHIAQTTTTIGASPRDGDQPSPVDNIPAAVANGFTGAGNARGNLGGVTSQTVVQNNGGGQPHENRQPWIAINYEIAMQGIYPSRS